MLLSIFLYSLVGFLMYLLGKWATIQDKNCLYKRNIHPSFFWSMPIILSILLFTLFYGLRASSTGVDTVTYVRIYEQVCAKGDYDIGVEKEPAFNMFLQCLSYINAPTWVYLSVFGFLMITSVYFAVRNNRYLFPYMGAFIILGPTFLNWANGMRQCLVECVFILSIELIVKKKLWQYVFVILLCSLMHKSAVLLLPFYWILKLRIYPTNSFVAVGVLMSCFVIGLTPTWLHNISFIDGMLYSIGYEDYSERLEEIISATNEKAFGPSRICLLIRNIWIVMTLSLLIKRYKLSDRFKCYASLFFIGICLHYLFENTSHLFLRPVGYLTSMVVIVAPLVLFFLIKRKKLFPTFLFGFLLFFYSIYVTCKAYVTGLGDMDPSVYSFYFLESPLLKSNL